MMRLTSYTSSYHHFLKQNLDLHFTNMHFPFSTPLPEDCSIIWNWSFNVLIYKEEVFITVCFIQVIISCFLFYMKIGATPKVIVQTRVTSE